MNGQQESSTADGDEADSDSTLSGSSSDPNLVGKANGAGGNLKINHEEQAADDQNGDAPAGNGAFNTAALDKRFSGKKPPGGKVCDGILTKQLKRGAACAVINTSGDAVEQEAAGAGSRRKEEKQHW